MDLNLGTRRLTRLKREEKIKTVLTLLCLSAYPLHRGFYDGCSLDDRLIYSFCHANIFHLLINLFVLWSIRGRLTFVAPFLISVLASFIPSNVSGVTMGLSGFLFAYFGLAWGKVGDWRILKIYKPFLLILTTMLMPGVNGYLHLHTFILGLIISFIHKNFGLKV